MGSMKEHLGNEKGMVLVVALMLLITLTVLGLAAISTTSTEIKIAGNERMNMQAFNAAEAGAREVLIRMNEPPGTNMTVDGVTFDESIQDPGQSPAGCTTLPDYKCVNPAWNAKIFFTGTEPTDPDADSIYTRTFLPATDAQGTDMWAMMNYAPGDTSDTDNALSVRYARESDYLDALVDDNTDGDSDDIVYYNRATDRREAATGLTGTPQTNGTVDYNPPSGLTINDAIRILTIKGTSGNAKKTVGVEVTRFVVNPSINAAVTAGITLNFNGNTFISGFNHDKDTVRGDANDNSNSGYYNDNGCDNHGSKTEATVTGCSYAPGSDPDSGSTAMYSDHIVGDHDLPGLYYESGNDPVITDNAADIYGGDGTHAWADDSSPGFPELKTMLNVNDTQMQDIINGANVDIDSNACPEGVTYINNALSTEAYKPPTGCDSGFGILYVTGDAIFDGNFTFKGLIYVEGDMTFKGNNFILGAVAVKGDTTGIKFQSGTPRILYSKDGLEENVNNALNMAGQLYTFLSWKEG